MMSGDCQGRWLRNQCIIVFERQKLVSVKKGITSRFEMTSHEFAKDLVFYCCQYLFA